MAIFWFILFLLASVLDGIWLWFIYSYAKDWPNTKEDFDSHMQEIYEKIKELND